LRRIHIHFGVRDDWSPEAREAALAARRGAHSKIEPHELREKHREGSLPTVSAKEYEGVEKAEAQWVKTLPKDKQSWGPKDLPTERVPIGSLKATQRYGVHEPLVEQRRKELRENGEFTAGASHGGDLPVVIKHRGVFYLADGHHRAEAAKLEGKSHIEARVETIPDEFGD
jgi:hypothetical protein